MSRFATLREPIALARIDESIGGLLSGEHLRRLREIGAATLLGYPSFGAMIDAELPALDRGSSRALLRITDALRPTLLRGEISLGDLAPLGLARLLAIAGAPDARRADMVRAGLLPLAELRRWARDERQSRDDQRLRRTLAGPPAARRKRIAAAAAALADPAVDGLAVAPASVRLDAARASIGVIRRAWRDASAAAYEQGRLLAGVDPDDRALVESLRNELELDRAEILRALDPIRTWPPMTAERAADIGLGALRAVAAMEDPEQRSALAARAIAEGLPAESIVALTRAEKTALPGLADPDPAKTAPTASPDEHERLAVLDLFFCERSAGPKFADGLPAELAEQIILRGSRPGAHLYDPTAGSGSLIAAAARLGRTAEGSDLIDPPLAPGLTVADALSARPARPADLIVLHPPVPLETIYTERYSGTRHGADLSGMDEAGYRRALEALIAHTAGLLATGGVLALVLRESRRNGRLEDWPGVGAALAERHGLTLIEKMHAPMPLAERVERAAREGYGAKLRGSLVGSVWTVFWFKREATR